MAVATPSLHPYRFSRAEYYAIAGHLNPALRYELLDGTIYAVSPAKPPHAGVVDFFLNRLASLVGRYQLRSQSVVEIEPDGSPEPDVAALTARAHYYRTSHPNGGDAALVIEVGDTEGNPRGKMRDYMRDGRIPLAWRADIPSRSVEIWTPADTEDPREVLRGDDRFEFDGIAFVVSEVFEGIPSS